MNELKQKLLVSEAKIHQLIDYNSRNEVESTVAAIDNSQFVAQLEDSKINGKKNLNCL
jgi:ribosomal protein S15P/S13E